LVTRSQKYSPRSSIEADRSTFADNGIYREKCIFVDFDYDYKTDIAIPKLRVGSAVNDQILIVDVNLNSSRKLRKKRFSNKLDNTTKSPRKV
jgi:hypothetical protein